MGKIKGSYKLEILFKMFFYLYLNWGGRRGILLYFKMIVVVQDTDFGFVGGFELIFEFIFDLVVL